MDKFSKKNDALFVYFRSAGSIDVRIASWLKDWWILKHTMFFLKLTNLEQEVWLLTQVVDVPSIRYMSYQTIEPRRITAKVVWNRFAAE